jgi:hypothetical protein
MKGFLGESIVEISNTPFKDYTSFDWAMYFIDHFGQIDGENHKLWVLDQVVRIHKGVKPQVKLAKWGSGQEEYRVKLGEPTVEYLDWVEEMKIGKEGDDSYSYDCGMAP